MHLSTNQSCLVPHFLNSLHPIYMQICKNHRNSEHPAWVDWVTNHQTGMINYIWQFLLLHTIHIRSFTEPDDMCASLVPLRCFVSQARKLCDSARSQVVPCPAGTPNAKPQHMQMLPRIHICMYTVYDFLFAWETAKTKYKRASYPTARWRQSFSI